MLWARIRSLVSVLRKRSDAEQEMADELAFHIEARADDLMVRARLTRDEALRRARLEFGSVEKYKEEGRAARGLRIFDALRADAQYSIRQLRKYPVFTVAAVLTIALGVGVNAAMFSVINGSLLKPLPVRNPAQITRLATLSASNPIPNAAISYPDYRDIRESSDAFEDVAVWSTEYLALNADNRTDRVIVTGVSGNFFSMLGIQPFMGRLIRPIDGELGGTEPIAVLGYSYWAHELGRDPAIIGKQIKLNGKPFTVVGVVPQTFRGVNPLIEFDTYVPMEFSWVKAFAENRSLMTVRAIARLKTGVSVERAQVLLDTVSWRLQARYPETNALRRVRVFPEWRSRPEPAVISVMPTVIATLLLLSGAVLLIACGNVLSLCLARGLSRRSEMAMRATLGASRWQLIRVCLVEAFLISALGGIVGTAAGSWLTSLLDNVKLQGYEGVPLRIDLSMDWRVLAYISLLILATTVTIGVLPAIRSARTRPNIDLYARATAAPRRQRLRQSLVTAQLAVSVAFLIVAGMFIQSLYHLDSLDLGFARDHMLLVDVDPAAGGYDHAQALPLYKKIEDRLRSLPGVRSTSVAVLKPFGDSVMNVGVSAEGQELSTRAPVAAEANIVGAGYFQTMEIPLVRGRSFNDSDSDTRSSVAVINEGMAAQLWPGQEAIGKRFSTSVAADHWIEVVGIVKASKQSNGLLPRSPVNAQLFLHTGQTSAFGESSLLTRTFYLRTTVLPESLAAAAQSAVRSIDGSVGIPIVTTMDEQIRRSPTGFGIARTAVVISAALGILGLVLALVGTYGALAFMVGQRTQEIGVRIAMGANPGRVVSMIVGQGLKLAIIGGGAGVGLGAALGRLLQGFLFNVSPLDPLIVISVTSLLIVAAFVTCILPARRATAIDPIVALKYE